jgi:hypothetical protein
MDATDGYVNYQAGNTYGLNANLPSAQSQNSQPGFTQSDIQGQVPTYNQGPGNTLIQVGETQTNTITNTAPSGYTPVLGPATTSGDVIGYNPSNQGSNYQSLSGYTGETPTGGGSNYYAPVQFGSGYIDFGSNYNPNLGAPGNNDYFYYSTYAQALEGGNNGVGLKGTNGTISYGTLPENQIQATSTLGTENNGTLSDPTINGIDYTQNASYAALAANGIGAPNPNLGGYRVSDFGQGSPQPGIIPYTQYTEPGYKSPTATAAGPAGTQSYNAQGQAYTSAAPSMTPEGMGTSGTFMYGDNGSAGTISGVFSNNTPGQTTQFYSNEPGSLTQGDPTHGLGTFAGQSNSPATATPGPTDTASNYFTYPTTPSASTGGVNQATGGVSGYNPLGLNQTNQTTLIGTDSALGFYGQVNPITGDTQANTNQTNPALQALAKSRQSSSFTGGLN